tara:strand:+ start:400 stop:558 length:159 start_codon:yes stop_codon:yes gene_type:complete
MKLTQRQMIFILKNNLIDTCDEEEKRQVFNFAFGEEYMQSKNKGRLKIYDVR